MGQYIKNAYDLVIREVLYKILIEGMRFEVFMQWRFKLRSFGLWYCVVLWQDTNHPEDGGTTVLQNTGILTQHYMISQPRRLRLLLLNIINAYFPVIYL